MVDKKLLCYSELDPFMLNNLFFLFKTSLVRIMVLKQWNSHIKDAYIEVLLLFTGIW